MNVAHTRKTSLQNKGITVVITMMYFT